jgi:phosphoglycolate phosphatase
MVLLDVDGTMVDSVPDLAHCVNVMTARLALPQRSVEQVRNWVGNGVERLVKRALGGHLDAEPSEDLYERAIPIFGECYERNTCNHSRLYPGAAEALQWLRAGGFLLACVTNKAGKYTEPLLRGLGIRDLFRVVVSGDTVSEKKPHPAPLLYAASHLGMRAEAALFVGDSVNDVEAARAAGFPVVCVTYGYNHGRDIRESHPDAVIDSLLELRGLLRAEAA